MIVLENILNLYVFLVQLHYSSLSADSEVCMGTCSSFFISCPAQEDSMLFVMNKSELSFSAGKKGDQSNFSV